MRLFAVLLAGCFLKNSCATPIGNAQSDQQPLLEDHNLPLSPSQSAPARQLHGRFLHITDLHPDPFYKTRSSTGEDDGCHRGKGSAGTYGAETSDCDTPFSLVNATFKWIEENIKDTIDFVVWTGDSARHDNDEQIPRNQDEVLKTNRWIVEKFGDVFGDKKDPNNALTIPIISTFGNNDILPHNILLSGPNKWLKTYTEVWSKFIPEEQRHGFERGGWYYVEVIPNKLAVFSLNTLYFFSHNAAVDGCALRSEPGFEHMEWLRIQLQFMRERGMKAILMGHVPPARTGSKQLWDETCWQKYTLWLKQFRDVVVGGIYGHMNIDHFVLQDTEEVDLRLVEGQPSATQTMRAMMGEELSIQSANEYLEELRENWSGLPNPAAAIDDIDESKKRKKGKKSKKDKALEKIGGPWGERFHVTNVGPSVVPNYFPTLRVIEYNITGLDKKAIWADASLAAEVDWQTNFLSGKIDSYVDDGEQSINKKKKGKKGKKKPKNPDLVIPSAPSKNSPPGPAYSPQTLTLLGYTQYFANLTHINNDQFVTPEDFNVSGDDVDADKWREGKHLGKHPKYQVPNPKPFKYQVEYDTFTNPIFNLTDMTVRSYIKLAHRIGQYKPEVDQMDASLLDGDGVSRDASNDEYDSDDDNEVDSEKKKDRKGNEEKKKKKEKKRQKQREKNKAWLQFIRYAFVGTVEEEELRAFANVTGLEIPELLVDERILDVQDEEL